MKTVVLLFLLVSFTSLSYAQCNPYFELKEGASWEMSSYNAKGKPQGSTFYKVKSLEQSGDEFSAVIDFQIMDEKKKEVMTSELDLTCEDGTLHYDMRRFIPQQSMEAYGQMDMEITGDNLEYPKSLSVGDELKEGRMNMKISGEGMPFEMNFKIEVKDRKVEAKESITTPAGTFDCYKISSITSTKTIGNIEAKSVEWIAPGKGVVRTESYNRGGKMMGYSELTKYTE